MADLMLEAHNIKAELASVEETSNAFVAPALVQKRCSTLSEAQVLFGLWADKQEKRLDHIRIEINTMGRRLYDIPEDAFEKQDFDSGTYHLQPELDNASNFGPLAAVDDRALLTYAIDLVSYAVGCSYGRWDIRLVNEAAHLTKPQDPFDPLPVCSPGMLVGPSGGPADSDRIRIKGTDAWSEQSSLPSGRRELRESDWAYPLQVVWDGILVDDSGHHRDVLRRVQDVLLVLWPDTAPDVESEICTALAGRDLREYLRRPTGFFADHLRRYSNGRRAPIFWPLSTSSGSYTIWLYYPRLSSDMLFAALNGYLNPKIAEVGQQLSRAREALMRAAGREASTLRTRVEEQGAFLHELEEARDELMRVVALPYQPNLDDGVIINAAPLHKLFRLPRWAKDTRETWQKLEGGDYDWAHLAYTIWPDRVRAKCREDRSIAIAHGLEQLYEGSTAASTSKRRPRNIIPEEDDDA